MSHLPANHSLRGLYRTLVLLISLGLIVFGVIGFLATRNRAFFSQEAERVWGMTTNPAFAVLSAVIGAILLLGLVLGRNIDVRVDIAVGIALLVLGTVMLALLRTPNNVLAFSVTNVNVAYALGMALITAGLYSATDKSVAQRDTPEKLAALEG
ncbi:MAG TPA: DUF4383 domain-containing protein [Mycobacteriales bacterium]|nr:DUF4383 domain-containing protein [Mycobacteriales bacterium]